MGRLTGSCAPSTRTSRMIASARSVDGSHWLSIALFTPRAPRVAFAAGSGVVVVVLLPLLLLLRCCCCWRPMARMGGFATQVFRMYDLLPLAIFVGVRASETTTGKTTFIQGCHGGIEVGWNPAPFLQVCVALQEFA